MIAAIPLDETKTEVCASFGRAPFFLLHDADTGLSELAPNPAAEAEGGAGVKAAQFVVDTGASILVTPRCGQNAAEVLHAADITIYRSEGLSASANLAALLEGKLVQLTSFHAGFHGLS